jgi:hypothetical protein
MKSPGEVQFISQKEMKELRYENPVTRGKRKGVRGENEPEGSLGIEG